MNERRELRKKVKIVIICSSKVTPREFSTVLVPVSLVAVKVRYCVTVNNLNYNPTSRSGFRSHEGLAPVSHL